MTNDDSNATPSAPVDEVEPGDAIALEQELDHDVQVMLGLIEGEAWWTR